MGTSAQVTINITAQGRNAQQVIASIRAQLAGLGPTFQQNTRQANNFGSAISKLRNQVFALKLAYEGAQFFSRFIAEGLKFNQVVESGILAIGALITATARLETAEGRTLVGAEALGEGMRFAADQVNKLRVDGLRTAATTEQLIDAFQQATGAGIAAGLTLDQIRRTTVQIVLAAQGLGVPMNQLNQEVRSILEATIDRNSRVARILGITNAQVKAMREQGRLAEFLNQKLQAFTVASEKSLDTWQVIRSNMIEAFQVLAGDITRPFFDKVKSGFKEVLGAAFDFDRAQISESFKGLVEGGQAFFAAFGDIVKDAISTAVAGAQELSEWFKANRLEVQLFVDELEKTARAVGSLVAEAVRVLGGIIKWGVESGAFNAGLKVIQTSLRVIEKLIGVIIVNQLLKATIAAAGLAKRLAGLAVPSALAGSGGLFFNLGRGLAALTSPVGLAVTALGLAAAATAFLQSRQEKLLAVQKALRDSFINQAADVTNLSTEFVKLSQSILDGSATGSDLANTLRSLAAMNDDLAKKNDLVVTGSAQSAAALRRLADEINKNVNARENLSVEQQKLTAALNDETTTNTRRIEIHSRLRTIGGDLVALEAEYTRLVKEATEATRKDTEEKARAAEQRFAVARADLALMQLELDRLRIQAEASTIVLPGGKRTPVDPALQQQIQSMQQNLGTLAERALSAFEALDKLRVEMNKSTVSIKPIPGFGEGDAKAKAARDKAENDLKQSIEAQIEIIKASEKRVTEELKDKLEANKISIADFTREMVSAQLGAIDQIVALRSKLVVGLSDKGEQAQQLGEIRELQIAAVGIITGSYKERLKLERDFNQKVLGLRADALKSQGNLAQAAALEAEKKYADILAKLRAEGSDEGINIVLNLINAERIKGGIEQIFNGVEIHQQRLDTNLANIQARVASGALAPIDAVRQTIQEYERMQTAIKQVQAEAILFAAMTKSPDAVAALVKLKELWNENEEAISRAKESMLAFRLALFDAVEAGFVEFLTADITKLDQFDNAFRAMAISIIKSIRQMIAQMIAFRAASAIFSLFGAPIPASQSPFAVSGVRAATGGFIRGPGTETSDSIPARLSRGEYVLSARTVRKLGVDLLDELNFGASRVRLRKRNHFSRGGLVETEATHGARGGELTATIGLEEGLFIKMLQSSGVRTALLKMVSKNPRAFRAAMTTG